MTNNEKAAMEAITRASMKQSGPVMRPTSELVSYVHILERIVGTRYSGFPYHELREYIAPHWIDVFVDMEV
jgi:hypothetical protein